jgi:hypothetical protein
MFAPQDTCLIPSKLRICYLDLVKLQKNAVWAPDPVLVRGAARRLQPGKEKNKSARLGPSQEGGVRGRFNHKSDRECLYVCVSERKEEGGASCHTTRVQCNGGHAMGQRSVFESTHLHHGWRRGEEVSPKYDMFLITPCLKRYKLSCAAHHLQPIYFML